MMSRLAPPCDPILGRSRPRRLDATGALGPDEAARFQQLEVLHHRAAWEGRFDRLGDYLAEQDGQPNPRRNP